MECRVSIFAIPREPWNPAIHQGVTLGLGVDLQGPGRGRGGYPEGNEDSGSSPLETPVSPGKSLSPFAFFLSYSFFPFWVTSQFTSIFPEMVDKLILLDTSPFGLDPNVRMGAFMRAVTGETQAPGGVLSPAAFGREVGGGGRG